MILNIQYDNETCATYNGIESVMKVSAPYKSAIRLECATKDDSFTFEAVGKCNAFLMNEDGRTISAYKNEATFELDPKVYAKYSSGHNQGKRKFPLTKNEDINNELDKAFYSGVYLADGSVKEKLSIDVDKKTGDISLCYDQFLLSFDQVYTDKGMPIIAYKPCEDYEEFEYSDLVIGKEYDVAFMYKGVAVESKALIRMDMFVTHLGDDINACKNFLGVAK